MVHAPFGFLAGKPDVFATLAAPCMLSYRNVSLQHSRKFMLYGKLYPRRYSFHRIFLLFLLFYSKGGLGFADGFIDLKNLYSFSANRGVFELCTIRLIRRMAGFLFSQKLFKKGNHFTVLLSSAIMVIISKLS
jgi:hypothetical protein